MPPCHRSTAAAPAPVMQASILTCFFISGATALAYELVSSRLLVRFLGNSLLSSSTVLAVFMGGLASGAYIASLAAPRKSHPLFVYVWLQVAAGISGLIISFVFCHTAFIWSQIIQLAGNYHPALAAIRVLFCTFIVFPPAAIIGAAFPVLCSQMSAAGCHRGRRMAYLYTANLAGSVFGIICSGFILLPAAGLSATLYIAAGANFFVAAIACLLACLSPERAAGDSPGLGGLRAKASVKPAARTAAMSGDLDFHAGATGNVLKHNYRKDDRQIAFVFVLTFLAAYVSMSLEVVWIRQFSFILGSSTYAFSYVIAACLSGSAAGSWLAARLSARLDNFIAIAGSQLLAGACIYLSWQIMPAMSVYLPPLEQILKASTGSGSFEVMLAARILFSLLLILPAALFTGAVFPLALNFVVSRQLAPHRAAGCLYAASTTGAITGAWLSGFVLIPAASRFCQSGMQFTLIALAGVEVIMGAAAIIAYYGLDSFSFKRFNSHTGWKPALPAVKHAFLILLPPLLVIALLYLKPAFNPELMPGLSLTAALQPAETPGSRRLLFSGSKNQEHILFYKEGLNSTITVGQCPGANVTYLASNGKVDVSVPANPRLPCPSCDLPTQVLLGQLPLLLHRGPVKQALVIGYGSGTTAGSMLVHPDFGSLTVAELESCVLEADHFFHAVNNQPLRRLASGRLKIVAEDGRNLLAGNTRFDVITAQPSEPWVAGSADLFTREFWATGASRLADDGLFCQWIQLYGITPEYLGILCRTFTSVFPQTIVFHPSNAAEIILIGFKGKAVIDPDLLYRRFYSPAVRRDLSRISLHCPDDVIAAILAGPAEIKAFTNATGKRTADWRINTDDNLICQYQLPRQLISYHDTAAANLAALTATPLKMSVLMPGKQEPSAASILLAAGQRLLETGNYTRAVTVLSKVSAADAQNVDAFAALGYAYLKLNNLPQAEKNLRVSLELDPNQYQCRLWLAKVLLRSGQATQGLRELKIAGWLRPDRSEPVLTAALHFIACRSFTLALQNINQLQARNYRENTIHLLAAVAFAGSGNNKQASKQMAAWQQASHLKASRANACLRALFKQADLMP